MFSLGQASYFSHLNCHPLFHKTLARVLERGALGHRQIASAINYNAPNQLFSNQWFALPSNIPAPGSLDFVIFVAIILTFTFILNLIFENFICNAISNVLLAINGGSRAIWNFFEGRQLIRNCCHIPKWIRNLKRVFDLWLVMTHQSANENNAFIWKPNSCSFMTCTWPLPIRWKYSG